MLIKCLIDRLVITMSNNSRNGSNVSSHTIIHSPPFLPLIIPNPSFPSTSMQRSVSFPRIHPPPSPSLHPHPFLVEKELEEQAQSVRRADIVRAKLSIFILVLLLLITLVIISLFCMGLIKVSLISNVVDDCQISNIVDDCLIFLIFFCV